LRLVEESKREVCEKTRKGKKKVKVVE